MGLCAHTLKIVRGRVAIETLRLWAALISSGQPSTNCSQLPAWQSVFQHNFPLCLIFFYAFSTPGSLWASRSALVPHWDRAGTRSRPRLPASPGTSRLPCDPCPLTLPCQPTPAPRLPSYFGHGGERLLSTVRRRYLCSYRLTNGESHRGSPRSALQQPISYQAMA
jgi:hypothetical protein